MIADPVDEAFRRILADRDLWPLAHLQHLGLLDGAAWARINSKIGKYLNTGRPLGEFTKADYEHRKRFLDEARAIMRKRGLKGDAARVRIAKEIHPRYAKLPSGAVFTPTSAEGVARKNCARSVRKR